MSTTDWISEPGIVIEDPDLIFVSFKTFGAYVYSYGFEVSNSK